MYSRRLVIVVPAHMHFSKARLDKKGKLSNCIDSFAFWFLTLKGSITTAADDKFCGIFLDFQKDKV